MSPVFDEVISELTEEELQGRLGHSPTNSEDGFIMPRTIDLQRVSTINFNSSSKFNISVRVRISRLDVFKGASE
jgi:hypothetical protein